MDDAFELSNKKDKITKQWVEDNFDIDEERRTKLEVMSAAVDCFNSSYEDTDEFIKEFKKEIDEFKTEHNILSSKKIQMVEGNRGYDACIPEFYFTKHRMETNEEVVFRIKKRERDKINKHIREIKRREEELQEYRRLHEKYGKGV